MSDEGLWRLAQHEAAHGVVAAHLGVRVREIILDSEIGRGFTVTREGPTPRAEAAIALAGIAAVPSQLGTDLAVALEFITVDQIDEVILQVRSEILWPYWSVVEAVARELLEAGTLPGSRVVELLDASPPRPPVPAVSAVTWAPNDW